MEKRPGGQLTAHQVLRIRAMKDRELEQALDVIDFSLEPFTAEWAELVLEEAERRGYGDHVSDEMRDMAAAPGLDDFALIYSASAGRCGRNGFADLWRPHYAAELRRRWSYDEACNIYQLEMRAGWLSEDLPPPPQAWWVVSSEE
jgi:hypothetical protein